MKHPLIILLVLSIALGLYLNRSYSKIYDRDESSISNIRWTAPVTITNPNFQNSVKYVAIGDSLTVGVGSKDRTKTLPYLITQKLASQMSATLINLAVSGATTKDVIKDQLDKAVAEKPNYITVFVGTNDLHSLVSSVQYEKDMDYIIGYLSKNTSSKILVFNIPYLGAGDLISFPYNGLITYQLGQYNKALKEITEKNNAILIDLYTPSKNIFSKQDNFYSSDKFHPSEEGYIMWATLVTSNEL